MVCLRGAIVIGCGQPFLSCSSLWLRELHSEVLWSSRVWSSGGKYTKLGILMWWCGFDRILRVEVLSGGVGSSLVEGRNRSRSFLQPAV